MPGTPVQLTAAPPPEAWTTIYDYAGGASIVYSGLARSTQTPTVTLTVTSVSKAASAVVTVTAHGLPTGATVTISGATGDWAGLNGVQTITNTGANTFTVSVNSAGYAGTFDGVITTTSPQTSKAIWSIQKNFYSGTNITNVMWANGSVSTTNVWDNRASLNYS